MTQGYHEAPDPRTGKAPRHQEAAMGKNISNAEVVPKKNHYTMEDVSRMSFTEFQMLKPNGYEYDERLDEDLVVAMRMVESGYLYAEDTEPNYITVLSREFFERSEERNMSTLRHEQGHDLLRGNDYNTYWHDVLEPFKIEGSNTQFENWFGASKNPEEIVADLYATIWHPNMYNDYESEKVKNLFRKVIEVSKIKNVPLPEGIEEDFY